MGAKLPTVSMLFERSLGDEIVLTHQAKSESQLLLVVCAKLVGNPQDSVDRLCTGFLVASAGPILSSGHFQIYRMFLFDIMPSVSLLQIADFLDALQTEGPLYWTVMAIHIYDHESWKRVRLQLLKRIIVLSHARGVAPGGTTR
jgi:hypothetical protein